MRISNRRANFDYKILKTYEAGIQLSGSEVKSIKEGRMRLEGSFAKIIEGEVFLINASIPLYQYSADKSYDPNRRRKLLLRKKEITSILTKIQNKNLTLVPLSCYTKHGLIKVQLGLCKGRKKFEKRREKRRRDLEKEMERELRARSA